MFLSAIVNSFPHHGSLNLSVYVDMQRVNAWHREYDDTQYSSQSFQR